MLAFSLFFLFLFLQDVLYICENSGTYIQCCPVQCDRAGSSFFSPEYLVHSSFDLLIDQNLHVNLVLCDVLIIYRLSFKEVGEGEKLLEGFVYKDDDTKDLSLLKGNISISGIENGTFVALLW